MPNTSNLKDTATTICGILFAIASSILTVAASGVVLPSWLTAGSGFVVAITGGIIGWLTGKTPSGATKSTSVIVTGNDGTNDIGGGTVGSSPTTKP